jgi:hypothetical protein
MERRRKVISLMWLLIPVFLLCGSRLLAQTPNRTDSRKKITVRVIDGVMGLPEWFALPSILIGSSPGSRNPRLNARGEIQIDVTEASPRTLGFLPNWYADCRYHGDNDRGRGVLYSLDDILETGVVGKNVCGWFHAKPQPGVIVFYVRHRTFLELMEL